MAYERKVLECIWKLNHPCLISEILAANPLFSRNTVSKALVSLEKKGYIAVDSIKKTVTRKGRAYKAVVTRAEYEQQETLLNAVTTGETMPATALSFVAALLGSQTKQVSNDFLKDLEDLVEKHKNNLE